MITCGPCAIPVLPCLSPAAPALLGALPRSLRPGRLRRCPAPPSAPSPTRNNEWLQSGANRIANLALRDNLQSVRRVQLSLYRRNPREWRKWAPAPTRRSQRTWDAVMQGSRCPSCAAPPASMRCAWPSRPRPQAFQGDRVAALVVGWAAHAQAGQRRHLGAEHDRRRQRREQLPGGAQLRDLAVADRLEDRARRPAAAAGDRDQRARPQPAWPIASCRRWWRGSTCWPRRPTRNTGAPRSTSARTGCSAAWARSLAMVKP